MQGRLIAGIGALLLGMAGMYVFMPDPRTREVRIDPTDLQAVSLGRDLYASQCAACHGAGGEGQPGWETESTEDYPLAPPHNGDGHTWQHPDDALFELTKSGLSTVACRTLNSEAMPKFEDILSDDQIAAVLSYIKSEWPPEILQQNADINAIYGYEHN